VLHYTKLEKPAKNKPSSLLGQFISYRRKKSVMNTAPGPSIELVTMAVQFPVQNYLLISIILSPNCLLLIFNLPIFTANFLLLANVFLRVGIPQGALLLQHCLSVRYFFTCKCIFGVVYTA
jgi:hypothetical protein